MQRAAPLPDAWYAEVPRSTRSIIVFGFVLIASTVVGFGVWAGTAMIAGAIVTTGVFVTTGQNKTIQHLEGGVIREIRVREGDVVSPDDVLIRLDETTPKAELRRLTLRAQRLTAIEARLDVEIKQKPEIHFPPELLAKTDDPDIAIILDSQRMTFTARRKNLETDLAVLNEGIEAIRAKIEGTNVQLGSVRQQLDLFDQELTVKLHLLKEGMIKRSEVLALQRAHANSQGEVGRLNGDIGDARERITRIREQMNGVRNTAIKAAVEQLHEIRAEQNDVRERMRAATGILDRINIVSPVHGIIVKLRYHTPGGVIEAGKSVMEIVPISDDLVIEARVRPQDIDHVKRGQAASIRLTALNQRLTPIVTGQVIYVSADALPDDKNKAALNDIYVARIRLDPSTREVLKDFTPTPGMPAEVYIKTSERTFFEYVTKPIKDSMTRAFRES